MPGGESETLSLGGNKDSHHGLHQISKVSQKMDSDRYEKDTISLLFAFL